MKLLLVSSSPRKEKSVTFALAKEVLKGTKKAGDAEIIHLCDYKLDFCQSCEECHKKPMHCPIKDGAGEIFKKMLGADGIILATPNYINMVAASLKTLFDRSSHFIHCKRLLDKYIIAVVSSGSGQNAAVLDYIRHYANTCGAQYSGGISSRAMDVGKKTEEAVQLGKSLVSDIKEKKAYPAQLEIIKQGRLHFGEIIKVRKDSWSGEYHYWLDQGWL